MLSVLVRLGAIFAAMTLIWLVLYSLASTAVGGSLQRSAMRRVLEAPWVEPSFLLGFRLAAEQRASGAWLRRLHVSAPDDLHDIWVALMVA